MARWFVLGYAATNFVMVAEFVAPSLLAPGWQPYFGLLSSLSRSMTHLVLPASTNRVRNCVVPILIVMNMRPWPNIEYAKNEGNFGCVVPQSKSVEAMEKRPRGEPSSMLSDADGQVSLRPPCISDVAPTCLGAAETIFRPRTSHRHDNQGTSNNEFFRRSMCRRRTDAFCGNDIAVESRSSVIYRRNVLRLRCDDVPPKATLMKWTFTKSKRLNSNALVNITKKSKSLPACSFLVRLLRTGAIRQNHLERGDQTEGV